MFIARLALCIAFAAVLFLFASMPISLEAQFTLALTVIGILAIISLFGPRAMARQLFVAFASVIILKYLYWRVTSTLPPVDDGVDFAAALILFSAELYAITLLYMTVFVVIDPLERQPVGIDGTAPLPTVDVFVPTYDESVDLVANTLAAAKALDYDEERLTVWLLDDGGTDEKLGQADPEAREAARERKADLLEVCNRLGVRYSARARNEMAKAGNLNHGLEHASGDLVVVLDADHAPRRDFLKKTVGHFQEDESVFLVQTAHAFLNDDPIERNLGLARQMPAEHQMFYYGLQKGLDSWNASFFCGSAAVLRRAALDEVGGFAGLSVTEDCETALELHSRGWTSRFVDEPLIWGLQPETFTSLIKQRSRWCSGMIQIFLLKNPVVRRGLTLSQRVSYTASCLYWFFPFMRLTFVFAPLLYLFFGMEIFMASVAEFFAYTAVYMVAAIMMQNFLFGRQRWAWMSEIYEYVQSVHLIKSMIGTLLAPRRPQFNVTPKGFVMEEERLSALATPYFLIFALLAIALVVAVVRIVSGENDSLLYIVTGWNLFNLVIAGMALGAVCDRRERRLAPRLAILRPATLIVNGDELDCTVADVSQRGLMARLTGQDGAGLSPGSRATLLVRTGAGGRVETEVVVRNRRTQDGRLVIGASFEGADENRFAVIAELMCNSLPTAADRMTERSGFRARNALVWTAEFLATAGREAARGLSFAIGGRRESACPPPRQASDLGSRLRGAVAARPVTTAAALAIVAAFVAADAAFAAGEDRGVVEVVKSESGPAEVRRVDATEEAQAAPTAPAVGPDLAIRRLAASENALFLQGEWARRVIPVHLTRDEIAAMKGLAVTARTSVTALQEATSVDLWVNGTLVGRIATRHDEESTTVLSVPRTLLSPGYNEIAITARHQHRAACELDAGYQLWTRILPSQTGFLLPNAVAEAATGLPQLLGLADDPTRLSVLLPAGTSEVAASRALRFAGLVAMAGRIVEPRASLVASRSETAGTLLTVAPDVPEADGTGWRPVADLPGVLARVEDGRTAELRLAAPDGAAADALLARLTARAAAAAADGSPRGRAALARTVPDPLEPGTTVTFAELGAAEHYFAGRHFRQTVFVDLPSDFVTTGEESVVLKLKGDYARDLSPDARLVIKVNGARVREMPLSATPETTLNHKPFVVPLSPFHAGRNRLTIEAELLTDEDAVCPPGQAAVERARFFLSGTSTIELPRLGRAGVTPNLSALYWDAFPYALDPGPTDVFVGEDRGGLDTAVALMTAITTNARTPKTWRVRFETPDEETAGIVVGAPGGLPGFASALLLGREDTQQRGIVTAAIADEAGAGYGGVGPSALGDATLRLAQKSWSPSGQRPLLSAILDGRVPPTVTVISATAAAVHDAVATRAEAIPFDPRGTRFGYAGASDAWAAEPAAERIFATRSPDPVNVWLVAGKWLSNHPGLHALTVAGLAGLLGFSVFLAARSRPRQREAAGGPPRSSRPAS